MIYLLAREHDCDGVFDTLMTEAAFDEQTYYERNECAEVTQAKFERLFAPRMNAHEWLWWLRNGFLHTLGGKKYLIDFQALNS